MATIDYVILPHHLKKDGTYNIKFRLTHKGKQVYKASPFHVNKSQIKKNFTIKDHKVLDTVNSDLASLRLKLNELGLLSENYLPKDLLEVVFGGKKTYINFIEYGDKYINSIIDEGRLNSGLAYKSIFNSFKLFVSTNDFDILKLNSSILKEYETFLAKGWVYPHRGKSYTTKGLTRSGLNNYMNVIKAIFNSCRKQFNTEAIQLIPNNPFDFYSIPKKQHIRKKGNDLTIEGLLEFRDSHLKGAKAISRDIFMLSFYLCGMNAIDLWKQEWTIINGRLEYERSKTKDKRPDKSFISIKIPEAAIPLLNKYSKYALNKRFEKYLRYKQSIAWNMPEHFTFYHARHTFATWAYNKCGFSKDHIAMALNHSSNKITDSYIAPDWSIIDRVQEGVLSLIATD